MNKKIGLVAVLVFLGFVLFLPNSTLAYEPCEYGDSPYCEGSTKWYCNGTQYTSANCLYGCSGGICNECTTNSYPDTCIDGVLTYCSVGKKRSVTCAYGSCASSTACAQCNSTSGCSDGKVCVDGSCVATVNCSDIGGVCMYNDDANPKCPVISSVGICDNGNPCCVASCDDYEGFLMTSLACLETGGVSRFYTDPSLQQVVPGCCIYGYNTIKCEEDFDCQTPSDLCWKCVNPKTVNSKCESTASEGTDGNCEDFASGVSFCNYTDITSKCDSYYGYTSGVTNPEEGENFTWTCKGQPASTCTTAGSTSGTCSVARTVTVNGQCGTTVGTCVSGTASGVGITEVTATGIDDVWTCGGTCSGTDASCRVTKCTNSPVIGGGCKSGVKGTTYDDLCYQGTLDYASTDADHNYINDTNPTEYVWSCLGSTRTCAEADGNDSLDCKSQIDQDAWFRTTGGRVLSKGIVNNYVPLTCEEKCYTTDRIVLTRGRDNLASHDPSKKYNGRDYSRKTYSYDFLKGRYLTARGVGTTINQSAKWSEISSNKGIIFINGDLTIDVNLETTDFMMLIAKNNIIIENTVNRIDGILTGKNIIASGESADQLIINGMVYGTKGVEFSRSFSPKNENNTKPAVEVIHNPGLIFKIPKEAGKWVTQYKVNI